MNIEHLQKKLLTEKEKLEREIKYYQKSDPYLSGDRFTETTDDTITEIEGHDRLTATKEEMANLLEEVREALLRIKTGKYGVCEDCGKKIKPERLEIMPAARYCLNCQGKKKEKV